MKRFAVAAILLVVASCSSSKIESTPTPRASAAPASSISANLVEWSIVPSATLGKAGHITFTAKNTGKVAHEFVIFKTDLSPFSLPTKPDGSVDEEKLDDVGEGGDLKPGESKTSTFELAPGNYAFVCNHVDKKTGGKDDVHYQLGMRTAFKVS